MNQQLTVQEKKQIEVTEFSKDLAKQTNALRSMLPAHIEVEKFQRAAVTAVQHNPDLLNADRQSLFNALTRCAGDGLLPDNREAAMVIYNTKDGNDWIKKAQYMPMVYGIIKRMRNSGEVSTIEAHVVYRNDKFDFRLGDDPKLEHVPKLDGERGKPVLVYCVVNFKDGGKYRELMSVSDVEKARSKSKNKDKGPWVDWWEEMAKKTVIHRAAKRLPASADLDKLLRHDMRVTLDPESTEGEEHENAPRVNKIVGNVESLKKEDPIESKAEDPVCATCKDEGWVTETDGTQEWQDPCPANCESRAKIDQQMAAE